MFRSRVWLSAAVILGFCAPIAHAQDNEPLTLTVSTEDGRSTDIIMQKVGSPEEAIDFVTKDIAQNGRPEQIVFIDKTGQITSETAAQLVEKSDFTLIEGDVAPLVTAISELQDVEGQFPDIQSRVAFEEQQKVLRERAHEQFFYKFGWGVTILKAVVSGVATYMAFDSWFDSQFVPTFMLATTTALIGGWYLRNVNEIVADCYALSDKVMGSVGALKRFAGPLTGSESKINLAARKLGVMTAAFTFVATIYYSSWTVAFLGLSALYVPGKLLARIHEFGACHGMGEMSMALVSVAFVSTSIIMASYQETIADIGPTLTVKAILNRMKISDVTRRMSLQVATAVIGAFSSFLVMGSNFAAIGSIKIVMKWATRANLVCFLFSDIFTKAFLAEAFGAVKARTQGWLNHFPALTEYFARARAKWDVAYEYSHLRTGVIAVRAAFASDEPSESTAVESDDQATATSAASPPEKSRCIFILLEATKPKVPQTYFVQRYRNMRAALRRSR